MAATAWIRPRAPEPPYPYPPVSHEPRIQQLNDDLVKAGYHPFTAALGILLDEADPPTSPCIRCTVDGYPCLVHAKADAETIAVLPALQHPNVTLLVDHEVTRLQTDAGGRTVTGVITQHGSAEEVFAADIVVVSAGATNSARLLLSSASDAHPNGLANGSDQVGRTTCSTTPRPWWRWPRSPTRPPSRRRSG